MTGRGPPEEEGARARADARESKRAASEEEEEEGVASAEEIGDVESGLRIRPSRLSVLCFLGGSGCHRDKRHEDIDEKIIVGMDFQVSTTQLVLLENGLKTFFFEVEPGVFFSLSSLFFDDKRAIDRKKQKPRFFRSLARSPSLFSRLSTPASDARESSRALRVGAKAKEEETRAL